MEAFYICKRDPARDPTLTRSPQLGRSCSSRTRCRASVSLSVEDSLHRKSEAAYEEHVKAFVKSYMERNRQAGKE